MKNICAAVGIVLLSSVGARAATVTYVLPDIGTFTSFENTTTTDTYTGDGFVGMYEFAWVHLFGIEVDDYSRTVGQVNLGALSGATINSAIFSFDVLDVDLDGTQDVTFTSFAEDGALDFNWSPTGLGSTTFSVTGGANAVDVTSLVSAFLAGPNDWFGFHLMGSTEFMWTYTAAAFGYGPDRANVRLTIDYERQTPVPVPEPSSLALAVAALGAVLGRRRRLA